MTENENMRRQYQVIGRYPINQYTLFLSAGLGDLFQSVSIFSQSYSSLAIIQKIIDNDGRSKLRYVDATCTTCNLSTKNDILQNQNKKKQTRIYFVDVPKIHRNKS